MCGLLSKKSIAKLEEELGYDINGDGVVGKDGDKSSDSGSSSSRSSKSDSGGHDSSSSDSSDSEDDHNEVHATGFAGLAFFHAMKKRKKREYMVVVDSSASMASGVFVPLGSTRWAETQKAITYLAEGACKADPNGLTLLFFNDYCHKFDNVKDEGGVQQIFHSFQPAGMTNLTDALDQAFALHFKKRKSRPTNILVISDGQPNDPHGVKQSIRKAIKRMKKKKELKVSFVQVGEDAEATAFLHHLDEGLDAKYDIVDKMHSQQLAGEAFSESILQGLKWE